MSVVVGYGADSFSRDVVSRWGALSEDLIEEAGLLHPQMSVLARLCASEQSCRDEILEFLSELLKRPDVISEIGNAVAISFIQWPDLAVIQKIESVPDNVAEIVKSQWDQYGSNS